MTVESSFKSLEHCKYDDIHRSNHIIYQQGTNIAHNVRGGLLIDLTIVAIALLLMYTLSMSLKLTDITQWR